MLQRGGDSGLRLIRRRRLEAVLADVAGQHDGPASGQRALEVTRQHPIGLLDADDRLKRLDELRLTLRVATIALAAASGTSLAAPDDEAAEPEEEGAQQKDGEGHRVPIGARVPGFEPFSPDFGGSSAS